MSYKILYIQTHLLCLLFLGLLFLLNLKHWRPRYINSLSCIYLLTAFSSVLDVAWVLLDGTNQFRALYHLVNIVYLSVFDLKSLRKSRLLCLTVLSRSLIPLLSQLMVRLLTATQLTLTTWVTMFLIQKQSKTVHLLNLQSVQHPTLISRLTVLHVLTKNSNYIKIQGEALPALPCCFNFIKKYFNKNAF